MNRIRLFTMSSLIAGFMSSLSVHARTPSPLVEAPAPYLTLSGGLVHMSSTMSHQLNLSTGSMPLIVDGSTTLGRGMAATLSIGRQWHSEKDPDASDPRHWRVELEGTSGRVQRELFQSRQLKVPLSDDLSFSSAHLNGLTRLWANENHRWWIGAGIGYAWVQVPDASASVPGCGCLASSEGDGFSWRVKTLFERRMSESTTGYVEAVYTRLPNLRSTSNTPPSMSSSLPSPYGLNIGIKVGF